jgi:hypothetical protein
MSCLPSKFTLGGWDLRFSFLDPVLRNHLSQRVLERLVGGELLEFIAPQDREDVMRDIHGMIANKVESRLRWIDLVCFWS